MTNNKQHKKPRTTDNQTHNNKIEKMKNERNLGITHEKHTGQQTSN